jgi:hypothetical protein
MEIPQWNTCVQLTYTNERETENENQQWALVQWQTVILGHEKVEGAGPAFLVGRLKVAKVDSGRRT